MRSTHRLLTVATLGASAQTCSDLECLDPYGAKGGDCILQEPWPEECPRRSEVGLSQDGLVFGYQQTVQGGWGFPTPIISNQEEFDDLVDRMGRGIDFLPIDFANNVVIGTHVYVQPTCGVLLLDHGLLPGPTLVVHVEDTTASCDPVPCDEDIGILVMYKVPRSVVESPAVCVQYLGSCRML